MAVHRGSGVMITTKQDINSRLDELFEGREFLRDWLAPLVAVVRSLHETERPE